MLNLMDEIQQLESRVLNHGEVAKSTAVLKILPML